MVFLMDGAFTGTWPQLIAEVTIIDLDLDWQFIVAHRAPAVIRPSSPTEICRRGLWSRCITPLCQYALKQPNWPLHPWAQQAAHCYGLKWMNCFTESYGTSEFPFPMWFIDFFTVLSYLVYLAKSTISNYLQEWGNTFFSLAYIKDI